MTPRDYQATDLQRIRELYEQGNTRLLVHYATGLGKGVLAIFIAQMFERLMEEGMLIIVPRREIAFQFRENVREILPSASVGIEMGEEYASLDEDVIIASSHTLGRRNSGRIERLMTDMGIIVNDEAHHSYKGGISDNVLSWFGQGAGMSHTLPSGIDPLVLHMTATPFREDEHSLAPFLDDTLPSRGIQFGVEQGWLTDIQAYKVIDSPSGVTDMDGYEADLLYRAYVDYCLDLSTIIFCPDLQVAKLATKRLNAEGIDAGYIDGETEKPERDRKLKAHREGEIDVILNYGCLIEGYDDPSLQAEIMARQTESERLYTQMLGRALRPSVDVDSVETADERKELIAQSEKPHAHIIDVAHNTEALEVQQSVGDIFDVPTGSVVGTGTEGDPDLVSEVVDQIDELDREQPERDLRRADPDTIKLAIRGVDVWSQTVYSREMESISPLRWVRHGEDGDEVYSLVMPRKPGATNDRERTPHILRIEPHPDEEGQHRILMIDEGGWAGRYPKRSDADLITTISTGAVEGAMKKIERRVLRADEKLYEKLRRDFIGPNEPASQKQIDRLQDAGYRFDESEMTALTADLLLRHKRVEEKVKRISEGEEGTTDAQSLLSNTQT
jgi:superfamily II DNA or RNA helicase